MPCSYPNAMMYRIRWVSVVHHPVWPDIRGREEWRWQRCTFNSASSVVKGRSVPIPACLRCSPPITIGLARVALATGSCMAISKKMSAAPHPRQSTSQQSPNAPTTGGPSESRKSQACSRRCNVSIRLTVWHGTRHECSARKLATSRSNRDCRSKTSACSIDSLLPDATRWRPYPAYSTCANSGTLYHLTG